MTASQSRRIRDVKEILKGLELERASHSATSCAAERMRAMQEAVRTGTTKHEWDGMGDGDSRDRLQM